MGCYDIGAMIGLSAVGRGGLLSRDGFRGYKSDWTVVDHVTLAQSHDAKSLCRDGDDSGMNTTLREVRLKCTHWEARVNGKQSPRLDLN